MAVYTARDWRIQVNVWSVYNDVGMSSNTNQGAYTSQLWGVAQTAGGTLPPDSWDKAAGGDISNDNQTYHPGGLAPGIVVGGLPARGDLTLVRAWSDDMIKCFMLFDKACRLHYAVSATLTPLKGPRTFAGQPIVYTGLAKSCKRPDADSNSATISEFEFIMSCNEMITGGGQ